MQLQRVPFEIPVELGRAKVRKEGTTNDENDEPQKKESRKLYRDKNETISTLKSYT